MRTTRVVQWKEREVQVNEIPREGGGDRPGPEKCEPAYAFFCAGHGRTNSGGSWTVSLPGIICDPPVPAGDHQPSFVATPTTDGDTDDIPRPFILVVRTQRANVTVWSFQPNGKIAPDVEFSWHCVVEGTLVQ